MSGRRLEFYPALDGLRGFILLVIFLFHLDYHWIRGGFLAVSTFYTLSGFLITGLLVTELEGASKIDLAGFWGRRFRRLMPAAIAGLLLVAAFGVFAADPLQLSRLRGDAISALFYSANWWFIYTGADYADLLGSPSPTQHFWSLNIEEQYYLVYPLVVGLLFPLLGRSRRAFAFVLASVALLSTAWMAILAGTDVPSTRMYYGTDTRCAELLAGGVLGLALAGRPLPTERRRVRAIQVLGVLGLAISIVLWGSAEVDSDRLYQGEIALYTLSSIFVITAALLPSGPVRRLLEPRWLQYIGRISYGAYIYHWPLFLWLTPDRTGLDGVGLAALRLGATLCLAALSYRFLEEPIRRGRRILGWRVWVVPPLASMVVLATFVAITGGIGGRSTQEEPSAPDGVAADAHRVLVVGDSVAANFFEGLEGWGKRTGKALVIDATREGCGIARRHRIGDAAGSRHFRFCDDWARRFPALLANHDPDLVLVYSSGWDLVPRKLPAWTAPRAIGDPEFDKWLRSEYGMAVDILSSTGARVLWVSPLCVEDRKTGSRVGVFDPDRSRRLREEILGPVAIAASDRIEILDLYAPLCPGGEVAQEIDGISGFRPDGIHFSADAKRWVGEWLGSRVVEYDRVERSETGGP